MVLIENLSHTPEIIFVTLVIMRWTGFPELDFVMEDYVTNQRCGWTTTSATAIYPTETKGIR